MTLVRSTACVVALAAGGALAWQARADEPAAPPSPEVMAEHLLTVPGFARGHRQGIEDAKARLRGRYDLLGEDSADCPAVAAVQSEHRRALDGLVERTSGRPAFQAALARSFAALPAATRARVASVIASEEFAGWFAAPEAPSSLLDGFGAALAAADRRERWRRAGVLDAMVATGAALKTGLADLAGQANGTLKQEATPLFERNRSRAIAALDACIAEEDRRLGNRN